MYTVNVRVVDDDGGEAVGSGTVRVNNVAPAAVTVVATSPIAENGVTDLTVTFTDPGTLDGHTVEVDWGDGTVETLAVAAGSRTFAATHQYLDDNPTSTSSDNYTVSVRVLDDDGGASAAKALQLRKRTASAAKRMFFMKAS